MTRMGGVDNREGGVRKGRLLTARTESRTRHLSPPTTCSRAPRCGRTFSAHTSSPGYGWEMNGHAGRQRERRQW